MPAHRVLEHASVIIECYLTMASMINTCRVINGDEYVQERFPHWPDLEAEFYNNTMHLLKMVPGPLADLFDRMVYYDYYLEQKKEVSNEDK